MVIMSSHPSGNEGALVRTSPLQVENQLIPVEPLLSNSGPTMPFPGSQRLKYPFKDSRVLHCIFTSRMDEFT